jgi:hypothetical protein
MPFRLRTNFVNELRGSLRLTADELFLLETTHVTSASELLSLLWNFPSLSESFDIDAEKLANEAVQRVPALLAAMAAAGVDPDSPPEVSLGAMAPAGAELAIGDRLTVESSSPTMSVDANVRASAAIDLTPAAAGWPVKDQGRRGTCVAFAVAALREHLARQTNAVRTFSEQFLYWATKTQTADPRPDADGTWIEFAVHALAECGVCEHYDWPYDPSVRPDNVMHAGDGRPGDTTCARALEHAHLAPLYLQHSGPGTARRLLEILQSGRLAALSLPVFSDPSRQERNNWNSPLGRLYGRVIMPPVSSIVTGAHAVCITGFKPNANEPLGGHFIVRNSWGPTIWGRALPADGQAGPAAGYGQVPASLVEQYTWEMTHL